MRKFLLIFFFCLSFFWPAFLKADKSKNLANILKIKADEINYKHKESKVFARNVQEINFQNFIGQAKEIFYDGRQKFLQVQAGFVLNWSRARLVGDSFEYDLIKKNGFANSATLTVGKIVLTGKKIYFSQKFVCLEKASFTTCDLARPHFELKADRILFFLDKDLLIAQWSVLKILDLPVAFLPAYLLSSSRLGLVTENQTLLPEISYDRLNGFKIEQRSGYFLNENLSGTFDLGFSSKRKFKLGGTFGYQINPAGGGNLRLHYYTGGAWEGGLTHQAIFGTGLLKTCFEKLFYQTLPAPEEPFLVATLNFSHQELINNSLVSFRPLLSLKTSELSLPQGLKFSSKIELGETLEKNDQKTTQSESAALTADLGAQKTDNRGIFSEAKIELNYSKFRNFPDWRWLKGSLGQRLINLKNMILFSGYNHYFYKSGSNPFSYNDIFYRKNDEIYLSPELTLGFGEVGLDYYFDLMNQKTADLDYRANFNCHCLILTLKWRSLRQEFSLGLNLKI